MTRAILGVAIIVTVLTGGMIVGALGALIEDTSIDLDDDE